MVPFIFHSIVLDLLGHSITKPALTIYRAITTTIITIFENNGYDNPNLSTSSDSVQTGTDGLFTVAPTYLPDGPLSWPACMLRKYQDGAVFTSQWRSVCSCQGVMPVTETAATVVSYPGNTISTLEIDCV
jgi:hypothetical protein